jgi:hypothetical protein
MQKFKIKFVPALLVLAAFWGCEYEQLVAPIDCNTSGLSLTLEGSIQNAHCGQADGAFEVRATGGEEPYTYSIDGNTHASGQLENLPAGNYNVLVTDKNKCTSSLPVSVQNLDGINITVEATEAGCGTTSGTIVVNASGGEMPYAFSLNGSTVTTTGHFGDLGIGEYEVLAMDNTGCEITQTVKISSGVSYSSSVSGIIQSNCAISGCHAGSISPDLRTLSTIQQFADRIKARTTAKTMPPPGPLPQSEIDEIACWVNDGALNN